jgi:TonB family protein
MRPLHSAVTVLLVCLTAACSTASPPPAVHGDWFHSQREGRWSDWNASFAGTVSYNGTGGVGVVCTDGAPLIGFTHPKLQGEDGRVRLRYRFDWDPYTEWERWPLSADRRSTQVSGPLVSRFLYRMARDTVLSVRIVDPAHNVEVDLDFSLLGFEDAVAHLPCVADLYVGAGPDAVVAEGTVLTPVDIRPSVLNRREVQAALWYECAAVRRRGIGGTVTVRLSLDRTGAVTDAVVHESGGHEALDRAVMDAVDRIRFSPAVHEGREVPAQVILHIHAGARR